MIGNIMVFVEKYIIYILLGFLVVLGIVFGIAKYELSSARDDIVSLNKSIDQYKKDAVISALQLDGYKESVLNQNQSIDRLSVDLNKTTTEYNKWKNQPERVKYRVIYKNKVMEIKSNDCNDENNSIDAVRHIDYNEL